MASQLSEFQTQYDGGDVWGQWEAHRGGCASCVDPHRHGETASVFVRTKAHVPAARGLRPWIAPTAVLTLSMVSQTDPLVERENSVTASPPAVGR